MPEDPTPTPDAGAKFTQADVDAAVEKIAAKIRAEERRKVSEKFADYDDLKQKAEGAKTADDRIAELQKSIEKANHEALKRRVQAAHGVSDEDADLFLTGADEESLTAQAKRLADRETERKSKGNHVPREGETPSKKSDDPLREFAHGLFGSDD